MKNHIFEDALSYKHATDTKLVALESWEKGTVLPNHNHPSAKYHFHSRCRQSWKMSLNFTKNTFSSAIFLSASAKSCALDMLECFKFRFRWCITCTIRATITLKNPVCSMFPLLLVVSHQCGSSYVCSEARWGVHVTKTRLFRDKVGGTCLQDKIAA